MPRIFQAMISGGDAQVISDAILVRKLGYDGREIFHWTGRLVGKDAEGLVVEAPFNVERVDLTYHRREPRGALGADLDCGGIKLRAVVTHLGLMPRERRFQDRSRSARYGSPPGLCAPPVQGGR